MKDVICYFMYMLYKPFFKPKSMALYMHNPSTVFLSFVIKQLKKWGYTFISSDELFEILSKKVERLRTDLFVCLSFDDGWKSNLQLKNFLENESVPATFFIYTDAIERGFFWWDLVKAKEKKSNNKIRELKKIPYSEFTSYLNLDDNNTNSEIERLALNEKELKNLYSSSLVTIGNHTNTHPCLNNCSSIVQEKEILDCHNKLKSILNLEPIYFAYPNGDYNSETIEILRQKKYRMAFTIKQSYLSDVSKINLLEVPRIALNEHGGKYENLCKLMNIWPK